jgi:Protein of unknown function (DUF2829)
MKQYLGVKLINAEPAIEGGFKEVGVHGGIIAREGYKVVYEDGYTSWSPKEVFEKAYREIDNLTFGLAIEALKLGKKVCRQGWNGKGMWLKLVEMDFYSIVEKKIGINMGYGYDEWNLLPWIGMKTVDNKFVPWLASQTDMLSEDWMILE